MILSSFYHLLVILNMSTYSKDDRTNANAISTSNTPDNIQ